MKLMFYALMVFVTTVTLTFGGAHTEVRDGLITIKTNLISYIQDLLNHILITESLKVV